MVCVSHVGVKALPAAQVLEKLSRFVFCWPDAGEHSPNLIAHK